MSELEAVTALRSLFRLLIDQYGPVGAGELVNVALQDATVGMWQVVYEINERPITNGTAFLSRAQGRGLAVRG